jgi:predicted DNA-binding protein (MmcQ/YjbR family)
MNAEVLREWLLTLPYVVETMQWGDNLVFWVADKSIGGKMFAVTGLDRQGKVVLSFAAGPELYAELLEIEGVIPAPYLARAYWVALERWDALSSQELKKHLQHARELVYSKLPKRTKDALAMSPSERKKLIAGRKKLLASGAKDS